jgi:hypothetical protein
MNDTMTVSIVDKKTLHFNGNNLAYQSKSADSIMFYYNPGGRWPADMMLTYYYAGKFFKYHVAGSNAFLRSEMDWSTQ